MAVATLGEIIAAYDGVAAWLDQAQGAGNGVELGGACAACTTAARQRDDVMAAHLHRHREAYALVHKWLRGERVMFPRQVADTYRRLIAVRSRIQSGFCHIHQQ